MSGSLGHGSVEFVSRGAALVCGPASLAVPAGEQLAKALRVVVCATDEVSPTTPRANPVVMRANIARISGCMGRFQVEARAGADCLADLGAFSGNPDNLFDLVLDLNDPPLIDLELKPWGYRAPGADRQAMAAAIAELAMLKGVFRKPLGIVFEPARCAHSAQGVLGCERCLTVCPAGAIHSRDQRIEVDAALCQGCSACMSDCPTGALIDPSAFPVAGPERRLDALDAILSKSIPMPADAPMVVGLSDGAPFGTVEVDASSCTLCMACAHICPTGALRANPEKPSLGFVESRCVQCHLCERACPERSMVLKPRLLLDPEVRQAERILCEDSQHSCPGCGAPFMGQALLRRSIRAMARQGVSNADGLERLAYCPSCRITFLAAGSGSLSPD